MKKPPEEVPGSASDWMTHAESDLTLAKLAATDQSILASQICFHCQQAAEKSIKAVLRHKGINFPLTHDLDVLIELLEQGQFNVPAAIQKAGQLTPLCCRNPLPRQLGSRRRGYPILHRPRRNYRRLGRGKFELKGIPFPVGARPRPENPSTTYL